MPTLSKESGIETQEPNPNKAPDPRLTSAPRREDRARRPAERPTRGPQSPGAPGGVSAQSRPDAHTSSARAPTRSTRREAPGGPLDPAPAPAPQPASPPPHSAHGGRGLLSRDARSRRGDGGPLGAAPREFPAPAPRRAPTYPGPGPRSGRVGLGIGAWRPGRGGASLLGASGAAGGRSGGAPATASRKGRARARSCASAAGVTSAGREASRRPGGLERPCEGAG